jgi:hypothetical protein
MTAAPFTSVGGTIVFGLHRVELAALRLLITELGSTLEDDASGDPAMERLLPDPAPTVPERSDELRRLIRAGLLDDRRDRLRVLVELLDRARTDGDRCTIELDDEEPWVLLGVLNDLRLTIGARIGIDELDRAALPDDEDLHRSLAALDHFGWWQWHLVATLDPEAAAAEPRDPDGGDDTDDGPLD